MTSFNAYALFGLVYLSTICLFVWARFGHFINKSTGSSRWLLLYDLVVAIHICISAYYYFEVEITQASRIYGPLSLITLSLVLFVLTVRTATQLKLALQNDIDSLYTRGPYSLVRHPYYLSYILAWSSTALMFNYSLLWITLIILVVFYIALAVFEERSIRSSAYADEYIMYCKRAGMFLPRMRIWKS